MLDTGTDVLQVANRVFFKPERSKTKFWQMVCRRHRTLNRHDPRSRIDEFGYICLTDVEMLRDKCGRRMRQPI